MACWRFEASRKSASFDGYLAKMRPSEQPADLAMLLVWLEKLGREEIAAAVDEA